MSLGFQVTDADFSAASLGNVLYPDVVGLTDLFFFGTDLPTSKANLVTGGLPLNIGLGAPTAPGPDYAQTDPSDFFSMQTVPQAAITLCAVAGSICANDNTNWGEFLLGNYGHTPNEPANSGLFIGHNANSNVVNASVSGVNNSLVPTNNDKTALQFYALSVSATGYQFYMGFNGALQSVVSGALTRVAGTNPLVIGASYVGFGAGVRTVRSSSLAVFNGTTKTPAQIASIYAALKTIYSNRGINTL